MANKIFNIRVKNKRDTEANWKKKNPVLLDGEIIIVTTTSGDTRFKVGDGKKTYNQLPFQDQKTRDLIPSVDSSLSSTSTNPVQNKIIKSELDKKAERDVVNTTTNGLMSVADKKKLDGIAAGANKTTVDSALSSTSTNPVQNKVVNAALINKLNKNADLTTDYKILTEKDVWAKAGVYAGDGSFDNTICLKCSGAGSGKVVTDSNALSRLSVGAPVSTDDATTKNYVDTELGKKLNKSGGTLTGNLTGKYITGTWLQTTEATDLGRTPDKIAVLDESGWVYYRTPAEIKTDIGIDTQTIIDTIYPYGSIYITLNQTSPSKLFPGTYWKQIKNRFLLSASSTYSASSVGGEATHALTTDEMPEHRHSIYYPNAGGPYGDAAISYPEGSGTDKTWEAEMCKTQSAGGGAAHNNMPPYLAVYMWERVHKDQVSGYNEDVYFIYGI